MELRVLLAPLYAAALGGLAVAAVVWRTRALPRWSIAVALGAVLAMTLLVSPPADGPDGWLALRPLGMAIGLCLIAAAAILAVWGTRLRRRAELILSSAPVPIDEAIGAARAGRRGLGQGVFIGRLGASEAVSSPGGVLGAFYDAEVRALGGHGARGALVAREQAISRVVTLRGERAEAAIDLVPGSVLGPVQVRGCQAGGELGVQALHALADGEPPVDALSFERVGKLGTRCLVAGQLRPGPVPGSYRLCGVAGNPALVVLGEDGVPFGRAFSWKARASFAAAAALSAASAACLAGF